LTTCPDGVNIQHSSIPFPQPPGLFYTPERASDEDAGALQAMSVYQAARVVLDKYAISPNPKLTFEEENLGTWIQAAQYVHEGQAYLDIGDIPILGGDASCKIFRKFGPKRYISLQAGAAQI
jgi:hypothetical protein